MPGYSDPGFDTLALHAGAAPDPATGARAVPIHLTTSFVFESSEHAASLFNLERAGHVYSRISNPTNAVLEERVAALEGGIEGRPDNVIFYATSNRRHLLPRDMMENERSTAINPGEAVEEKVSLSDRFGLWLGFHRCSQDEYLSMVFGYAAHFALRASREELRAGAIEWAATRGARSGRTAWQYIQDLAGKLGQQLG